MENRAERFPHGPENNPPMRPRLEVDLSTGDGLPFNLVAKAVKQLEGEQLVRFSLIIWLAAQRGSGATYNDFLRIVDDYTELVDTSGTFGAYAPNSPDAKP